MFIYEAVRIRGPVPVKTNYLCHAESLFTHATPNMENLVGNLFGEVPMS